MLDAVLEVAAQDGRLRQCPAGLHLLPQRRPGDAEQQVVRPIRCGSRPVCAASSPKRPRPCSRSVTPTASTPTACRPSGFLGSTFADLSFTLRPTHAQPHRARLSARLHERGDRVVLVQRDASTRPTSSRSPSGLALDISGRYVHRNYGGSFVDPTPGRTARMTSSRCGVTLDYFVRNWIYVGVGYSVLYESQQHVPTESNT